MIKTVIGIFDTNMQAQAAVEALVSSNFKWESINIALQEELKGRGDVTDEKNTQKSSVASFFRKIFDNDASAAQRYAAVAQQGAMVVVHTNSMEEAEKAAALMDGSGAINVDERARLLEDSWTRHDRTAGYGDQSVKVFPGVAEYDKTDEPAPQDTHIEERTVSTGEVRVHSRIIDRPAGPDVRIREEHISMEPRDSNRVVGQTGSEIPEEDNV
jgi:hypothetical protein